MFYGDLVYKIKIILGKPNFRPPVPAASALATELPRFTFNIISMILKIGIVNYKYNIFN